MDIEGGIELPDHVVPVVRGSAGSATSLALRLVQALSAILGWINLYKTNDSALYFKFSTTAMFIQFCWSFLTILVDFYSIVTHCTHWGRAIIFAHLLVDGILIAVIHSALSGTATIAFEAPFLGMCEKNPCVNFYYSVSMTFICLVTIVVSFYLNYRNLRANWYSVVGNEAVV